MSLVVLILFYESNCLSNGDGGLGVYHYIAYLVQERDVLKVTGDESPSSY